jgi:MFS family permease
MTNQVAARVSATQQIDFAAAGPNYPKFRWAVLAASCLSVIAFGVTAMSYGPILGEIAANLGVSLAHAVNLMSFFMLFAALSYFVAGPFCDRFGVALTITASTVFSAIPTFLTLWVGHSFAAVAVLRALQGCAVGFAVGAVAPLVLQWFPREQRGIALGISGACNPLGIILGVMLAPLLFRNFGDWQRTVALLSLFGWFALVYCLVVFNLAKSRAPVTLTSEDKAGAGALFRAAMQSPVTWIGVLATFATNWVMQCAFSLSPSYFAEAKPIGLSLGPLAAGQLMGVVQIGAIVGPLIGGLILDKVFHGRAKGMLVTAFLLSFVYAAMQWGSVYNNRSLFLVCLLLSGAGIGMQYPLIQSLINETYHHSIIGRMNGIWMGLGAFGGSAGLFANSIALGRTGSYLLPINIISSAAIFGALMSLLLRPGSAKAS